MSLSTTQYGYIIDPLVPLTGPDGQTIRNGYAKVFLAGSSTPVITYANFDGTANQERIELDNSGRTAYPVIVSKGNTYKVCVYDAEHSQESPILTIDKVVPAGANVEATTIVTGLDNVESPEAGWVKSSVSGTDAEVSLDATNVTSEVDTMVKATAASADYMMPLVHKTGSDPDKKITLGNIFKFVLNFIHSLTDTATEADLVSGNYFAIDGSAGTKKLNSTTLLTKTAQNALAGNVAYAFDPTRDEAHKYLAGESVAYKGKTYTFKVDHYGAWNALHVYDAEKTIAEKISDNVNLSDKNACWKNIKSEMVSGKIYDLSVGTGNSVDLSGSSFAAWSLKKSCVKGDVFKIKGYSGTTIRLYGFVNSDSKLVEVADASYNQENYIIVIAPCDGWLIYQTSVPETRDINALIKSVDVYTELKTTEQNLDDAKKDVYIQSSVYEYPTFVNKKSIYTAGNVGDTISITEHNSPDYKYCIFECVAGDVFRVAGKGGNSPRLWCFVDSSDKIVAISAGGAEISTPVYLVAPSSGKFIYNTLREFSTNVADKRKNLEQRVKEIDDKIDTMHGEILAELDVDMNLVDVSSDVSGFTFNESTPNTIMTQVYTAFDALVTAYPDFVTKTDAAETLNLSYPGYASEYKTYCYKFSDSNSYAGNETNNVKKKLFIVSGVHGDEIAAPANAYIFAKRLCEDCLNDENIFRLISAFDIYIVPCLNGYGLNNHVRTNGNGVDINRNYPTSNWSESGSGTSNYTGPSAGSEFETKIVTGLCGLIEPDVAIDHHNYADLSWQFYTTCSNPEMMKIIYQLLTDCSRTFKKGYPQYFGTGYSLLKDAAGAAPAEVNDRAGAFPLWLYENSIAVGGTVEISDNINYDAGEVSLHTRDRWGNSVFSIGEFTLRAHIMRYCAFALKG